MELSDFLSERDVIGAVARTNAIVESRERWRSRAVGLLGYDELRRLARGYITRNADSRR